LLPVWALLQACAIRWLAGRSRALAVAVLLLALLPDRADLVRGRFSLTLQKYVDEITHHVPGPIEAIVTHLRTAARPGDRVFISYGDLPLRFTRAWRFGADRLPESRGLARSAVGDLPLLLQIPAVGAGAREDEERTLQYLKSEVTLPRYRTLTLR
jgi:hypothetical protein